MDLKNYVRKPFSVTGVQVTEENFEEVADWCGGDIRTITTMKESRRYIKVKVRRPVNDRQTKAYVGDWVLLSDDNFKVYSNNSFEKTFDLVEDLVEV